MSFPALILSTGLGFAASSLAAPPTPASARVHTFRYKSDSAKEVSLAGSFFQWKPRLMTQISNEWFLDVFLQPGQYRYHFMADGAKVLDPENTARLNDESLVTVSKDGPPPKSSMPATQKAVKTAFHFDSDSAKEVSLAGSFFRWEERPMRRSGKTWSLEALLLPGNHRYHFVVDGKKTLDPAGKSQLGDESSLQVQASGQPAVQPPQKAPVEQPKKPVEPPKPAPEPQKTEKPAPAPAAARSAP